MSRMIVAVLAIMLLYGCAGSPSETAPATMEGAGGDAPSAPEQLEQETSSGSDQSVTLGDGGTIGSGSVEDEGTVSGGGSMGMVKADDSEEETGNENSTEPVVSGSGGQIVDVGGSLPAR